MTEDSRRLPPRSSHRGSEARAQAAALLDVCRTGLRVAAPVVDLLVRLSLAKAFFDPGMLPNIPALDALRSAWAAIAVQVSGPVLLGAGFLVRPVSLLMLVLTLLAQAGAPHDEHLFWAALFGWYVVQGAGPLSLDQVLGKGMGLSPLPLAGRAMAAADWFDRQVAPIYRLALRLWLAAAVAGTILSPMMLPGAQAGMLPHPAALLAAVCLASRPRNTGRGRGAAGGEFGGGDDEPRSGHDRLWAAAARAARRFRRRTILARSSDRSVVEPSRTAGPGCAAHRHRGRGFRRDGVRRRAATRARARHRGRPAQLPFVPAATLSGRDRQSVAGRHHDTDPQRVPR